MRRIAYGLITTVAAVAAACCIVAARKVPTIRPNTFVEGVAVGGLSKDEAARQIRSWWEQQKLVKLKIEIPGSGTELPERTPGSLGVTIDDVATVDCLPMSDLASNVENAAHMDSDRTDAKPIFKSAGVDLTDFGKEVRRFEGTAHPAHVTYRGGSIFVEHEAPSQSVDWPKFLQAVADAITEKKAVEIPLKVAVKRVPDEALAQIKDVVAEYSTHFPASNRPRCSNIKLASSKLNGIVLMPGEKLSFNGTVGRRTLKAGFQVAGIYKNGKHDVGIGGGICQVSTTLYNASLFADLRIRQRSNHSLPVAYVPLGRDATVDYGSLDLIIQNSYSTPIAIASHYVPGRLTFTVLGKKDPSLKVRIEQSDSDSWSPDVTTIVDRHLKPGSRRVIEPGSEGRAVSTYRLVYRDGKLVRREQLGRCTYGGQDRVVAVNPLPAGPKVAVPIVPPATAPSLAPTQAGLRG
jgi:vancomycin resistance protein YoaR